MVILTRGGPSRGRRGTLPLGFRLCKNKQAHINTRTCTFNKHINPSTSLRSSARFRPPRPYPLNTNVPPFSAERVSVAGRSAPLCLGFLEGLYPAASSAIARSTKYRCLRPRQSYSSTDPSLNYVSADCRNWIWNTYNYEIYIVISYRPGWDLNVIENHKYVKTCRIKRQVFLYLNEI